MTGSRLEGEFNAGVKKYLIVMTNTRLEAALQAVGDGARLEQLVTDLLASEGYDVTPTGKRGPDGGRDAFLAADGEDGILHCSTTTEWEPKAHSDAEKAVEEFDQEFDFFIFATNEDPAAVKRDRVEDELTETYGMRTTIYDFEIIRNALLGSPENHILIREHLSVDPRSPFEDVEAAVDDTCEDLVDRLKVRESPAGPITDTAPLLAIHVISHEAIDESHDRFLEDLPKPPVIGSNRYSSTDSADYRINSLQSNDDDEVVIYTCLHKDGWIEGVTCNEATVFDHQNNEIRYTIDRTIVEFVEDALDTMDEADFQPPYYVYITLLGFKEYTISEVPGGIFFRGGRPLDTDHFRPNRVCFDHSADAVPAKLSRTLSQIWQQAGWTHSMHYERTENDDDTYDYHWNPR